MVFLDLDAAGHSRTGKLARPRAPEAGFLVDARMESTAMTPDLPPACAAAIGEFLADADNFEQDEIRPNADTVARFTELLSCAHLCGDVSAFWGEMSTTWKTGKRTARLVVPEKRAPFIWRSIDSGIPLPTSESLSATPENILAIKEWLDDA